MRKLLVRIGGMVLLVIGAALWVYGMIERAARAARAGQKKDDALKAAAENYHADTERIQSEPTADLQEELTRPLRRDDDVP